MATTICAGDRISTSVQDCKLLARAQRHLARAGLDAVPLAAALNIVRHQTVRNHGMRHYLYAMLGRAAHLPIQDCELLDANGNTLPVDPIVQNREGGQMRVADYIESQYNIETMPVAVKYHNGDKEPTILVL